MSNTDAGDGAWRDGRLPCSRKDIINYQSFTVARMPAKVVSEIKGAKYAQNSHTYIIYWLSIC